MRRLLERLRQWELDRAYRLVARLELLVPNEFAAGLRVQFAGQTIELIDTVWKARGLSRQDRKQLKRRLIGAGSANS